MDALLSDEQNDLRLATASLARDIGTETDSELGEDGPQARAWTLLGQSGLLGLRMPNELGAPRAHRGLAWLS